MDFLNALQISASGLSAQRMRINLITSNLANADTTSTAEGGPYKRKDVILGAFPVSRENDFRDVMSREVENAMAEVKVVGIVAYERAPRMKYAPGHPDANGAGYVAMPNINVIEEMANMMVAARSYEANLTAIQTTKSMAAKALEIGR
ncbi:Flagellar basal-body rod protein FlgC [uncultured Desulfatiglans sp.]|uniref:Flagellar basal-body rod protein FlgC n=1 Tax=Uncultured Desulfatiglans sp. TaxID=1748965 RepID=A0A653A352_UNCDX|nr:Flagellar basal-body rod protein FlgC [uncultured Desulfatiglans sp.]